MKLFILLASCALLFMGCGEQPRDASQQPLSKEASPQEVIAYLKAGNKRFYTQHPKARTQEKNLLHQLAKKQDPHTVVITCSDSRVSPSVVLDQSIGELFIIRTAGHVIGEYELGSIEYAVAHLNVKAILVIGHYDCGAIGACMANHQEFNHIQSIIDTLRAEREEQVLLAKHDHEKRHYVEANTWYHTRLLRNSEPVLKKHWQSGELLIVPAVLDEQTGKMHILDDKTNTYALKE